MTQNLLRGPFSQQLFPAVVVTLLIACMFLVFTVVLHCVVTVTSTVVSNLFFFSSPLQTLRFLSEMLADPLVTQKLTLRLGTTVLQHCNIPMCVSYFSVFFAGVLGLYPPTRSELSSSPLHVFLVYPLFLL